MNLFPPFHEHSQIFHTAQKRGEEIEHVVASEMEISLQHGREDKIIELIGDRRIYRKHMAKKRIHR